MIANFLCRYFGHKINRHRVAHDGANYRTNCQRCGQPMIRDWDGWREDSDKNSHQK
ncbi:DUF1660 family phage protein [Altericroceibacterium indicum]|uniref:DUF1660 family phage protein n=1 Tax=Altericroceibacterium indicum TaxID=374177 RepID=UPI003CCE3DAE